jgi:hypothetical protein
LDVYSWSFFLQLALLGLVCRPSPKKARASGRLAGVVFRGHRQYLPPDEKRGRVRTKEQDRKPSAKRPEDRRIQKNETSKFHQLRAATAERALSGARDMKAKCLRLSPGFMKRKRSGAEINPGVSLPGAARVCGIFEA